MFKNTSQDKASHAIVKAIPIGPEKNFCYFIMCVQTKQCVLIDPAFEVPRLLKFVDDQEATLVGALVTHGHWDHAGGIPELIGLRPTPVYGGTHEVSRLQKNNIVLDHPLNNEQVFKVGNLSIQALHTPGHTEGGCCYLLLDENRGLERAKLFSGDTLFVRQCGRTDLPGGSDEKLFESLQRLKELPDSVLVMPGHDYGPTPNSPLGVEKRKNPTMLAASLAEFRALP